jgi:hypothetical protein
MKTAMQEAIEYLKSFNLEASAIILEDKFLEIEKKQHETTFHRGINIGAFNPDMDIEGRNEASKHYYECTFEQLDSTFGQLDNEKKGRIQDISIG